MVLPFFLVHMNMYVIKQLFCSLTIIFLYFYRHDNTYPSYKTKYFMRIDQCCKYVCLFSSDCFSPNLCSVCNAHILCKGNKQSFNFRHILDRSVELLTEMKKKIQLGLKQIHKMHLYVKCSVCNAM